MDRPPFPDDADPRALAAVMIAKENNVPELVLIVTPGRCECILGRVYPTIQGKHVLTGVTHLRSLVAVAGDKEEYEEQAHSFAVMLDDPDRLVTLACRHGGTARGEVQGATLARIRSRVKAARSFRQVLVL